MGLYLVGTFGVKIKLRNASGLTFGVVNVRGERGLGSYFRGYLAFIQRPNIDNIFGPNILPLSE